MGVLIVDDETELADAIATYLQAFGLEAEYVVDGASALAAFDARPPKLVVLDVNLPDVNGFEVCRAMQAKSDVPILFLSARGSDDDQILALGLGVTMTCASPSPWRCCRPGFAACWTGRDSREVFATTGWWLTTTPT